MGQLIYGRGGLRQLPTSIEEVLLLDQGAVITGTGRSVTGSPNLDTLTSMMGVAIGALVTGLDVPPGTTVLDVDDVAHTVVLSANVALGHAAPSPFTFRNPTTPGLVPQKVMLFKAPLPAPWKGKVIADLVAIEADYDGYARSSVVAWSPPLVDSGKNAFITGDKKQFACTGSVTPNTIYGAALVSSDGLTLEQVDVFVNDDGSENPINMSGVGNGFDYVPVLSLK